MKKPRAATAAEPKQQPLLKTFRDARAWEAWLAKHHDSPAGVWLRIAKTASKQRSVAISDALDVALCYGWIDGQRKSDDAEWYLQKFTPRRARSLWSKLNQERVERLVADGRMQPPGLAEVERAKSDGRWAAAYGSHRTATVPADLQAALDASPRAAAFFETLDRTNRYAILFRVQAAVKAATREKRIEKFVGMLERGERIHE